METVLSRLTQLAPLGAVLLAEVKSSSLTIGELAAQLDVAKREVSMLRAIAKVFDAEELAQATKLRLSVSKLRLISRTDKQLANPDINRRDFRLDLMKTAVDCTVDELAEHIKSLIGELNAGYNRRRKWYLRCSELADADNMRHIIMKLPSHVATRIMNSLEPQGRQWVQEGQAVDKSEGLAKALADRVLHGIDVTTLEQVEATENPNNPRDLRQRPCFLVPIANIQSHNDGTVTNTDGESVDIRELVDARLAEFGFAVACYNGPDGAPNNYWKSSGSPTPTTASSASSPTSSAKTPTAVFPQCAAKPTTSSPTHAAAKPNPKTSAPSAANTTSPTMMTATNPDTGTSSPTPKPGPSTTVCPTAPSPAINPERTAKTPSTTHKTSSDATTTGTRSTNGPRTPAYPPAYPTPQYCR